MAAILENGIPLSALAPKFLHTNSTSHTWPFSAIAELIDNAYDPDVAAKHIWIDKTVIKENICLTFMDDGNGMDRDTMHKMLSFGFSDKVAVKGHVPVGLYGNGFKSGSMRLGKDAIVFSKNGKSMSIGLLSQSYHEAIKAEHVLVPLIPNFTPHQKISEESKASLEAILKYSLFNSEKELTDELKAIDKRGTRIIIWNLRRSKDGTVEFDFNTNKYDIRIPDDVLNNEKYKRQDRLDQAVPESDYSLRAYCSILYLKPKMQIILRGQKVKTQLISKSLAYIEKDVYKPSFLKNKVTFTFGYNTKSKEQYGIMMYHKNRLIKAYERVGCQLKANNCGVGVIGITECNFLKPTHNKQDFDYTNEYRLTMQALGNKLWDYWKEMKYKRKNDDPFSSVPVEDTVKQPDQNWAQCDECLKWRKLPDGIDTSKLPDNWYCRMNPDTQFRLCSAPEEKEDEDEDHPTYEKTYKREEKINKIKVDHNRQTTMSCQSATSSNLVITDVRSLFAEKNPGPRIKRTLQTNLSRPDVKKLKLNEVQRDLKDAEDPDILIVETKSSPRPSTKADITSVKVEHNDSLENSDMCMEYTDGTVDKSATSMPLQEQHKSITTQTEQKRVLFMKPEAGPYEMKNAKEDEWKKENGIFDSLQEQEKSIETQPKTASQELLNYQKKVADLEQQIIELKEKCVKKEHINQLVQTDSITEYNSLLKLNLNNDQPGEHRPSYEKMLIEMEKLRERCKELETVKQECRKCRLTEDKSFSCKLEDGLAIQPDNIFRKPHSSDEELEKYKEELEAAQQENARIRSECEVLRKHVESMTSRGLTDMGSGSCSTAPPEMTSESMEETIGRLKALRINVGKLLVTYVPALDLEQVNYESDVIDEMLDQILDQVTLTSVS